MLCTFRKWSKFENQLIKVRVSKVSPKCQTIEVALYKFSKREVLLMQVFLNSGINVQVDQQYIGRGRRNVTNNTVNELLSAGSIMEKLSHSKIPEMSNDPTFRFDESAFNLAKSIYTFNNNMLDLFNQLGRSNHIGGFEGMFAKFEQLHHDISSRLEGDELMKMLFALEKAFKAQGKSISRRIAFEIQMSAEKEYRSRSNEPNESGDISNRFSNAGGRLFHHINDMFRAALNFFKSTGSFSGFMATSAANVPGQVSFRDVDTLHREMSVNANNGTTSISSSRIVNSHELSDSGRNFLNNFFTGRSSH